MGAYFNYICIMKLKGIKKINLPTTYLEINETREIFGSQIIAAGIDKLPNGEIVKANKKYLMPIGLHKVNHTKKIKKIAEKKGIKGVENYINDVIELAKMQLPKIGNITLGSFNVKRLFH